MAGNNVFSCCNKLVLDVEGEMGKITDVGDASGMEEYDEELLLVEASDEKLCALLPAIISSIVGDVEMTMKGSLLTSGCCCRCCCCCCSVMRDGTNSKLKGGAAVAFAVAVVDDVCFKLLLRETEDVFSCCECI